MNRDTRHRRKNRGMTNYEGERRAGGVEDTRKGKDRVPEGRGFYAPATPSGGTRPVPRDSSPRTVHTESPGIGEAE
jgi:hypothetical protein